MKERTGGREGDTRVSSSRARFFLFPLLPSACYAGYIMIASQRRCTEGFLSECSTELLSSAKLTRDQAVLLSFLAICRLSHSPERLIAGGYGLLSRVVTTKLASDTTFYHAFFFSPPPKKGKKDHLIAGYL